MSIIKGSFFPHQVIPAKALGALGAKAIADGILTGCGISYAGTALTIGRGFMVACGRVMELPTAETLLINGAASGYARVSVLIDTTKTSTQEIFNQADFLVEYSATEDGFAEPYSEDINMDGSLYQLPLCVLSLSASGISAVVVSPKMALSGGVGWKVLWANASPASAFAAQTLSVPGLKECNLVKGLFRRSSSAGGYVTQEFILPGEEDFYYNVNAMGGSGGAWTAWQRQLTFNRAEETVEITSGLYAYSGAAEWSKYVMVPLLLWGQVTYEVYASNGNDSVGIESVEIEEA